MNLGALQFEAYESISCWISVSMSCRMENLGKRQYNSNLADFEGKSDNSKIFRTILIRTFSETISSSSWKVDHPFF